MKPANQTFYIPAGMRHMFHDSALKENDMYK